jgi:hypothetical protein
MSWKGYNIFEGNDTSLGGASRRTYAMKAWPFIKNEWPTGWMVYVIRSEGKYIDIGETNVFRDLMSERRAQWQSQGAIEVMYRFDKRPEDRAKIIEDIRALLFEPR